MAKWADWNEPGPRYHRAWSHGSIDPTEQIPEPEDVAHSLAQENRFNGCCYVPHSVAAHTLNCLALARQTTRDAALLLNVLCHDVEEAVWRDLPTWLKRYVGMAEYTAMSVAWRLKALEAWGIPNLQDDPLVKQVDTAIGETEYRELVVMRRAALTKLYDWEKARREWIAEYWTLKRSLT